MDLKELNTDEKYNQEKQEWIELIKDFINTAHHGNKDGDAHTKIENYEFLRHFNFDILNMENEISEEYLNILSFKTNIRISVFKKLLDERKKYTGGCKDPDNMKIVRAILLVIFNEDKLKKIYDNFQKKSNDFYGKINDEINNIVNNKTCNESKEKKIKETFDLYKKINNEYMLRPDTMNSYRTMADNKYEDVFSDKYLNLFRKNELNEIERLERDFYYDYHIISNFCLLPNESKKIHLQEYIEWIKDGKKIVRSDTINTYRGTHLPLLDSRFGKDNFYSYLFLLKNKWNRLIKDENEKDSNNLNTMDQLFLNNNFFYKEFNDFEEYCVEMMIDYDLYKNREYSKLEDKKAYFTYNKLIIDYRWNQIKGKLFDVLNEDNIKK